MTILEAITLSVALLGAILGVLNTWHAISRDQVNLRVVPRMAFGVGSVVDQRMRLCVEVVNLSAFAVTVDQVGFAIRDSSLVLAQLVPILLDGGPFPRRLESRTAFTVYFEPGMEKEASFGHVRCAFARTDCGVRVEGTTPLLRSLVAAAPRGPKPSFGLPS
jgi:hypothetical protein